MRLALLVCCALVLPEPSYAKSSDVAALERRVAELNRELERAKADLETAKEEKIAAGGGRKSRGRAGLPRRAGTGKNYNFLHTGWLGYRFQDDSHVEVGVNRVPFGPGPYGVSQSWFFDQHYYVGLSDDMDLGIKYVTAIDNWALDVAYYAASEGSYFGRSENSARYSYDAVKWRESIDEDGNVAYGGEKNGYSERNQFNVRAICSFTDATVPTDLGVSLQYGQLKGQRADDGSHWAASAHMVNQIGGFKLATQLTRYQIDIDGDDYSNVLDGVGDFGVTGNDKWNYRFNINLGYYVSNGPVG